MPSLCLLACLPSGLLELSPELSLELSLARWNSQRRTVIHVYSPVLSVRELGNASQMPRMEASGTILCFWGKQWSMHILQLIVHNKASICKSTFKMNTSFLFDFFCKKECHSYTLYLIFHIRHRAHFPTGVHFRALILLLSVPSTGCPKKNAR